MNSFMARSMRLSGRHFTRPMWTSPEAWIRRGYKKRAVDKKPHPQKHKTYFVEPKIPQQFPSYSEGFWARRSRWIKWPTYMISLFSIGWGIYCRHIEQVPITGRWQFNTQARPIGSSLLFPDNEKMLDKVTKDHLLPSDLEITVTANKVLSNILEANNLSGIRCKLILVDTGIHQYISSPDGTIMVSVGALRSCKTEAGLAFIFSVLLADIIAHHGLEKISYFTSLNNLPVGPIKNFLRSPIMHFIAMVERRQAKEADYMALVMMSRAGYALSGAVELLTGEDEALDELIAENKKLLQSLGIQHIKAAKGNMVQFGHRIRRISNWIPQIEREFGGVAIREDSSTSLKLPPALGNDPKTRQDNALLPS